MHNYKYITFSGGGAKGAAYPGAYKALKESKVFDNIKCVSGSSAGAMTAALAASGISQEKLYELSETVNFKGLLGEKTHGYGIERNGDPLYELMNKQIKNNILEFFENRSHESKDKGVLDIVRRCRSNEAITFKDLSTLNKLFPETFKDLAVTAVEKETGDFQIFNAQYTPEVDVALAVRASASIPVLLKPVTINNTQYIDGGYFDNLPTDDFQGLPSYSDLIDHDMRAFQEWEEKNKKIQNQTLLFAFGEGKDKDNPVHKALNDKSTKGKKEQLFYSPGIVEKLKRDWLPSILGGTGRNYNYTNTQRKEAGFKKIKNVYQNSTVELKVGDIKTTDFAQAQKQSERLLNQGYLATISHLASKGLVNVDDLAKQRMIMAMINSRGEDAKCVKNELRKHINEMLDFGHTFSMSDFQQHIKKLCENTGWGRCSTTAEFLINGINASKMAGDLKVYLGLNEGSKVTQRSLQRQLAQNNSSSFNTYQTIPGTEKSKYFQPPVLANEDSRKTLSSEQSMTISTTV
ncbi:patatin-like phospholipase family protein [Facilibium subflavum]|uniref:patatin-like phospholipase family protein n=1 Tax=Facilibium subflavum TaxID=2219058 RepID=UPI000E64E4A9|nr:patatin-like phospholipase family protein [Facilibium subflavum]